MSEDISFARKYRPHTLEGYVGNEKIKDTVRRIMASGKKPQSILLTGNTGCGKTTLSRILESWYMCENPNIDGSPCGECITCENMKEYIETGNAEMLPDIKEIDITDKSGKNDMDALLEEIEYPAYGGGWKVYMMDECHAMSTAAATRLLKVLEEPPERVLIIFCTTDPQKMLETLKNRCQLKLKVTKPSTAELCGLLKRITVSVGKDFDMQGFRMICSRADYVIRDSLNLLEQVINSRGDATGNSVSEEFQEVSDNLIFDFYKAYLSKDYLGYINIMYKIKTTYDFSMFLNSLTNFTVRGIYILNNVNVEGLSDIEIKSYMEVFSKFSIEDIAYTLSSLKRMSIGDIESNLMSFIYTEKAVKEETPIVEVAKVDVISESRFRNDNLKTLEKAKVKESVASLEGTLEEVGFEDAMSLFSLEKVNK